MLSPGDYANIFSGAKSVHSSSLLLLYKPSLAGTPRLGLVIAKKKIKRATQRNTVKRLAREQFRRHKQFLPNIDIAILVKKPITEINKTQLNTQLSELMRRLVAPAAV